MLIEPATRPAFPWRQAQQGAALLGLPRHLLPAEAAADQLHRHRLHQLGLKTEGPLRQDHHIHRALGRLRQRGRQALLQPLLLVPLKLAAGGNRRLQHQHSLAAALPPQGHGR